MADTPTYCLGLQLLGECSYKPGAPYSVYFSLGEAISALAFTIAIQQLLKPIFHLRLAVRSLTIGHLYAALFVGAAFVLLGAVVPHVPALHNGPWGFAIIWETLAALIFATVYGTVIWVIARPAAATPRNMLTFCRQSARLLASASDADRVDYIRDLAASAPALVEATEILERPPMAVNAFWEFIYRKEIERGSLAWQLLRLLADPLFCRVAIRHTPWSVARIMNEIEDKKSHSRAASQFVRELAFQAVFDDESMMAREVEYTGFGTAPILSDSIFRSPHIIQALDPFDWLFSTDRRFVPSTLKRFCKAFEAATETMIEAGEFNRIQAMFSSHRTFEAIAWFGAELQEDKSRDFAFAMGVAECFQTAAELAQRVEQSCPSHVYSHLFRTDNQKLDYTSNMFGVLVDDIYEGLERISNKFASIDDPFWSMMHHIFGNIYRLSSDRPGGMTPLQQRLAMKIVRKVRDNMNGYYPAITRVMLAAIGPYGEPPIGAPRSAYNILRDAFYAELKSLRVLAAKSPDKVTDYLPPNVTYDVDRDVLVHTYRGGSTAETSLRALSGLVPLDLTHATNLHAEQPPRDER